MAKDELVDQYDFDIDPTLDTGAYDLGYNASVLKSSLLTRHKGLVCNAYEMGKFIDSIDEPYEIPEAPNASTGAGPQGKKGIMDGEKLDSMWEGAVYAYYKYVKGVFIERNHTEWVPYVDDNGKKRKFYPDFKLFGRFIEVKGIYRAADRCKMTQHPEIEFIDKTNIKPIWDELNKKLPNWKKDYIFI